MFTTRPEIVGTFGVASSTHWLASQTAMGVLERGGNAFDAAVAGGFVLQVVEPHLNGAGGEVPILFWSERDARVQVIHGQGCAPADATPAAFGRLGMELVPGIGLNASFAHTGALPGKKVWYPGCSSQLRPRCEKRTTKSHPTGIPE